MSNANHYDVIIIGSGAGGGTLAHRLAPSGKKILIIERGDFVPREKANWDSKLVNLEGKYQTKEHWYDAEGKPLHPHTNFYVGGNTKFYGAALFRLRSQPRRAAGGIEPDSNALVPEYMVVAARIGELRRLACSIAVRPRRTAMLKSLDRRDVRRPIIHTVLVEVPCPGVPCKIFERREIRAVLTAPRLRRM